jgi:hypothetical protein
VADALGPDRYHWRAPFFARTAVGAVEFPAITQEEMDLEIDQAAYGGLDYWVFVAYARRSPMSGALDFYLSSPRRGNLKFCLFTELGEWGTANAPSAEIQRHLELMRDDSYIRVFENRPLYFLGFIDELKIEQHWGSIGALRNQMDAFRDQARMRGLGNPYLVLDGNLQSIDRIARELEGDAVSAYALQDRVVDGAFAALSDIAENGWRKLAQSGLPVLPTVMTGWDRRPRIEHPVPWEASQKPGVGLDYYFEQGKPREIAQQVSTALSWIAEQPRDLQAPAVVIYAWNENDEGGWLIPTGACEHQRLTALHQALASDHMEPKPFCGSAK